MAISVVGILLVVHPRLAGNPAGRRIRHRARSALDDPPHVPGDRPGLPPVGDGLGPAHTPGFLQIDGTGFFTNLKGDGWLTVYIAYSFLLTWNVIAMEAAACYIGECRDPERDAKIAMNLEGLYGLFIYTMIPISFVVVLGASSSSNAALATRKRSSQLRHGGVSGECEYGSTG